MRTRSASFLSLLRTSAKRPASAKDKKKERLLKEKFKRDGGCVLVSGT